MEGEEERVKNPTYKLMEIVELEDDESAPVGGLVEEVGNRSQEEPGTENLEMGEAQVEMLGEVERREEPNLEVIEDKVEGIMEILAQSAAGEETTREPKTEVRISEVEREELEEIEEMGRAAGSGPELRQAQELLDEMVESPVHEESYKEEILGELRQDKGPLHLRLRVVDITDPNLLALQQNLSLLMDQKMEAMKNTMAYTVHHQMKEHNFRFREFISVQIKDQTKWMENGVKFEMREMKEFIKATIKKEVRESEEALMKRIKWEIKEQNRELEEKMNKRMEQFENSIGELVKRQIQEHFNSEEEEKFREEAKKELGNLGNDMDEVPEKLELVKSSLEKDILGYFLATQTSIKDLRMDTMQAHLAFHDLRDKVTRKVLESGEKAYREKTRKKEGAREKARPSSSSRPTQEQIPHPLESSFQSRPEPSRGSPLLPGGRSASLTRGLGVQIIASNLIPINF